MNIQIENSLQNGGWKKVDQMPIILNTNLLDHLSITVEGIAKAVLSWYGDEMYVIVYKNENGESMGNCHFAPHEAAHLRDSKYFLTIDRENSLIVIWEKTPRD